MADIIRLSSTASVNVRTLNATTAVLDLPNRSLGIVLEEFFNAETTGIRSVVLGQGAAQRIVFNSTQDITVAHNDLTITFNLVGNTSLTPPTGVQVVNAITMRDAGGTILNTRTFDAGTFLFDNDIDATTFFNAAMIAGTRTRVVRANGGEEIRYSGTGNPTRVGRVVDLNPGSTTGNTGWPQFVTIDATTVDFRSDTASLAVANFATAPTNRRAGGGAASSSGMRASRTMGRGMMTKGPMRKGNKGMVKISGTRVSKARR